jgi:hypothetical protein
MAKSKTRRIAAAEHAAINAKSAIGVIAGGDRKAISQSIPLADKMVRSANTAIEIAVPLN